MTERNIAIALHSKRAEARQAASDFIGAVAEHGIRCWLRPESARLVREHLGAEVVLHEFDSAPADPIELAVVFGGDGTILRAAEWAVPSGVPVLGVNLGHVGFLAELDPSQQDSLVGQVIERRYDVEQRMCIEVTLRHRPDGDVLWNSFAINEVSLEKASRERMIEVLVEIDGHPLQRWGTDGVLVSTPTGSTAYAFSAQGPVMWPDLEALLVVPLLAHALFARPLVLSPLSVVTVSMLQGQATRAVLSCDGRRTTDVEPLNVIEVRRSPMQLKLARLDRQPFVERLVRKFELPVSGWRGNVIDAGREMTAPRPPDIG